MRIGRTRRQFSGNLTLTNPRILDSKYTASFSGFHSLYYNWHYMQTTGASIIAGRLLTTTLRASLGYNVIHHAYFGLLSSNLGAIYRQHLRMQPPAHNFITHPYDQF